MIERFKYREWDTKFADACQWIESLGVDLDRTRVAKYRKSLSEIVAYHDAGKIEALRGVRGDLEILSTLAEVGEFVHIHLGLKGLVGNGLVERLAKFCAGVALKSEETSQKTSPRNFGFELSMASLFRSAGLPVDLETHSDIFIPTRPFAFSVECKRPSSPDQVEKRIREGLKQLETAYKNHPRPPNARGILAVDISKLENDGNLVLRATNEREVKDDTEQLTIDFIRQNQRHWIDRSDPRTLAVLIYISGPAFLGKPPLLTAITQTTFACVHLPGSTGQTQLGVIAAPVDSDARNRNRLGGTA